MEQYVHGKLIAVRDDVEGEGATLGRGIWMEQVQMAGVDELSSWYKRGDCAKHGKQLDIQMFNVHPTVNRVNAVIPDHRTTHMHHTA